MTTLPAAGFLERVALLIAATLVAASFAANAEDGSRAKSGAAPAAHAEPAAGSHWIEPYSGIEFSFVPSGCFAIGSHVGDASQRPVKQVCVKGFWMARTEVTQAQYQKLIGQNPSYFRGSTLPVENVSFDDAVAFAGKLSQSAGASIRLPAEAEWEYACRAGTQGEGYCGAGDLSAIAWWDRNSRLQTHPVGEKRANAWGLYDMNGNVWEWTLDCWNPDFQGLSADGRPRLGGQCERRVMRGGSWNDDPVRLSVAFRDWAFYHRFRFGSFGFRVIREIR